MTAHDEQNDAEIDDFFSAARVSGRDGVVEQLTDGYQNHLYPLDDPKLVSSRGMHYEEFAADRYAAPFLRDLLEYWHELYREPFTGITSDGRVQGALYELGTDTSAPDARLSRAAQNILSLLTPGQREQVCYDLDAPEWRAWSNPEFMVYRVGLRLEYLDQQTVDAVLRLLEASLSPEGFEQVQKAMRLNGLLGELVDLPEVMNDRSYWFSIFGTPSPDAPWGWQLFGHHVALNFVTVGGRQVIAPVFLGGEPATPGDGSPGLFDTRERLAIALAESLTPVQREQAVVYRSVLDPSMPEGRLHPADERHVAGAFRDNRVVAYEGINATALTVEQRALLRELAEDVLLLLVEPQREQTLRDVDAHLDDTWFAWYGATDGSEPFYFRLQSPVILAELDHHAGVWLSNRLPARFHVHTTLRLPNGNDYGRAYLRQWAGVVLAASPAS